MTLDGLPLHPVIVHLPLALAFFLPIAALLGWKMARRGEASLSKPWALVAALQGVLMLSAIATLKAGEAEEDVVKQVVDGALIHDHEEAAEGFLWAAIAVTALAGAALVLPNPRVRNAFMISTLVGTVAVAGLAARAGHSGGTLVYRHGAANAYRN